MSKQSKDDQVIPVGMVLMATGLIVVLTAVIILILLILPKNSPHLLERQQVVVFPSTPVSAADVALLPETPLETEEMPLASAETLAFVRGQPERIVIPALNLDAPVSGVGLVPVQNSGQTYYQWQVPLEYRAGWHNTSAPLGTTGNTVLNGHHNIAGEVSVIWLNWKKGMRLLSMG
ncbi:MAG: hypothetical protein HC804_00355 [Anaerolineae bacterium]|nr:hypothetical protein [Anaerolineae bacterium]